MHMPDGVLDPTTLVGAGAAATGALAWSAHEVRRGSPRLGAAVGGVAGLLIAHLADVPLYGPYTAHLIGGTLLAIAIGPSLALVSMASALAIEALLWHDGGTAAWGANVLVMGVVGVLVGYGAYRGALALAARLRGDAVEPHPWSRVFAARLRGDAVEPRAWSHVFAAAGAAWLSVMASAVTLSVLVATGGADAGVAVDAASGATAGDLLLRYAGWGLLEASVTGVAVAFGATWMRAVARIETAAQVGCREPVLSS